MYGIVSRKFPISVDDNLHHTICLNSKTCSLNCLYHKGHHCREYIVFATLCNISVLDMYPAKYTTSSGLSTLKSMKSKQNDLLASNINSLPFPDVIITPPHIRAPKGRRPTKRFTKPDKNKSYLKQKNESISRQLAVGV